MSVADQIQALQNDKTAIANAITAKGGTVNSGDGFDDFAADIATIPSGSTPISVDYTPGGTSLCTGIAKTQTFTVNKLCKCAYLCVPKHGQYYSTTVTKGWLSSGGTTGTISGGSPSASVTVDVIKDGAGNAVTKFTKLNIGYDAVLTLTHLTSTSSADVFMLSKTKDSYGTSSNWYAWPVDLVFVAADGDFLILPVNIGAVEGCFSCDTLVTLADGTKKRADKITYDDDLLSWDFDKGCQCSAKPLWIKKAKVAPMYQLVKLKSGREIKLIGPTETGNCHRIFCTDTNRFEYVPNMIGKHTIINGEEDTVESWYWVPQEIKYTNIVANYHMCIYTNDILTSCRRSNEYPIENMKYVKDDRELRTIDDYDNIPVEFFNGLRLSEQTRDVTEISFYVENMISGMKPKK